MLLKKSILNKPTIQLHTLEESHSCVFTQMWNQTKHPAKMCSLVVYSRVWCWLQVRSAVRKRFHRWQEQHSIRARMTQAMSIPTSPSRVSFHSIKQSTSIWNEKPALPCILGQNLQLSLSSFPTTSAKYTKKPLWAGTKRHRIGLLNLRGDIKQTFWRKWMVTGGKGHCRLCINKG